MTEQEQLLNRIENLETGLKTLKVRQSSDSYELLKRINDVNQGHEQDYQELRRSINSVRDQVIEDLNKSSLAFVPLPNNKGWLLEKHINPEYVDGVLYNSGIAVWVTADNGILIWTPNASKALRFARREDAEKKATLVEDCEVITEHSWS